MSYPSVPQLFTKSAQSSRIFAQEIFGSELSDSRGGFSKACTQKMGVKQLMFIHAQCIIFLS